MLQSVYLTKINIDLEDSTILNTYHNDMRIDVLKKIFINTFSTHTKWMARAGGRLNLIGEHVDYPQSQFVGQNPAHLFSMGCAVEQEFLIAINFNQSGVIEIAHADAKELLKFELKDLKKLEKIALQERESRLAMDKRTLPVWAYHSLGGIVEAIKCGANLKGVQIMLTSTVPFGAGMSNSAANLVSLGLVFDAEFKLGLEDKTALASFARDAENGLFSGGNCGFLDQLLICYSQTKQLTKIDYANKNIDYFKSALPTNMNFVIINTNVPHVLAESDYAIRVAELSNIHSVLSDVLSEKIDSTTLSLQTINKLLTLLDIAPLILPVDFESIDLGRDLSDVEIDKIKSIATEQLIVGLRRLRHQKASSLIVPLAGKAAEIGDADLFGTLLNAEGKSLRMSGDFQITGQNGAQDALLDCGFKVADDLNFTVYGRMLGGGGGGNVLFFVDSGSDDIYQNWKAKTAESYSVWAKAVLKQDIAATVIEPNIASGASLIK